MQTPFFRKKDAALAIKDRFKAAQLLPKQLFAGWQFTKNFNQSSRSFHIRPPKQLEQLIELAVPGRTAVAGCAQRANAEVRR
ncbi:MAG: hypothetical protein JWP25_4437 [Bradyrhizobium sp.]|jgi:hypothetical protein|nr:hypothetical protein [Bradyrhizobium sp.]